MLRKLLNKFTTPKLQTVTSYKFEVNSCIPVRQGRKDLKLNESNIYEADNYTVYHTEGKELGTLNPIVQKKSTGCMIAIKMSGKTFAKDVVAAIFSDSQNSTKFVGYLNVKQPGPKTPKKNPNSFIFDHLFYIPRDSKGKFPKRLSLKVGSGEGEWIGIESLSMNAIQTPFNFQK